MRLLRKAFPRSEQNTGFHLHQVPSVTFLLQHREERQEQRAMARGDTPTDSLYRMYEYLVIGFMKELRAEIGHFLNKSWPVSETPDPRDPDPQRYTILSVLPFYLTIAYNRLIELGLPRAALAINDPEMEGELKYRRKISEEEPSWVNDVSKLEEALVILDHRNLRVEEDTISFRFLAMSIVAETPHVLFV